MNKPPFQFSLKSVFTATMAAAVLTAIASTVPGGVARAFGAGLAGLTATAAFIFVTGTILFLGFLLTVLLFEPAVRRPTLAQVKRAARMLAISAVLLAAEFALLCLFID